MFSYWWYSIFLWLLSRFALHLWLTMVYYLLWVSLCLPCFDSCILYPWISFINFGKFSSIISLKFFTLSFSSGILITFIYDYIISFNRSLAPVHFVSFYFSVFLTFCNFYCSVLKFSYSSVMSVWMLLKLVIFFQKLCIFGSKISFSLFLFLCWDF